MGNSSKKGIGDTHVIEKNTHFNDDNWVSSKKSSGIDDMICLGRDTTDPMQCKNKTDMEWGSQQIIRRVFEINININMTIPWVEKDIEPNKERTFLGTTNRIEGTVTPVGQVTPVTRCTPVMLTGPSKAIIRLLNLPDFYGNSSKAK